MASSLPAAAGPGAGRRRSWRPAAIAAAAVGAILLLAVLADGRLLVADADPSAVTDADVRLARSLFSDSASPEALAEACIDDAGTIDPTCLGDGQPGGRAGGRTDGVSVEVVPRACRDASSVSAECVERELGIDVPGECTDTGGGVDVGCLAERGDLLVLTDVCIDGGRLPAQCLKGRVFGVPDPGPESGDRPADLDLPLSGPGGDEPSSVPVHEGGATDAGEDATDRPTPDPAAASDPLAAVTRGLGLVVVLALVAGVVVVLVLALRRWRARPAVVAPDVDEDAHDRAVMAASLDASAQQLDPSGGDARQAIIAAYAMLLEGLAACAQGRRPAETPLEHLERVLATLDVRPDPLRELTALFGEARFSDHAMTDHQRDRARAALEDAAADLDRVRETVG